MWARLNSNKTEAALIARVRDLEFIVGDIATNMDRALKELSTALPDDSRVRSASTAIYGAGMLAVYGPLSETPPLPDSLQTPYPDPPDHPNPLPLTVPLLMGSMFATVIWLIWYFLVKPL